MHFSCNIFVQTLWIVFLVLYHFILVNTFCAFEEKQSTVVQKQNVNYHNFNFVGSRVERSAIEIKYESIRITESYHDLDEELSDIQQEKLKFVISRAIHKVQSILSVHRVVGPLLLSRSNDACYIVYQSGVNAGKCADVQDNYRGEVCIDNFMIPDEHLDGLEVYDEINPEPKEVIKEKGSGADNTDFILYIRSLSTDTCLNSALPTTAYASYCHLDQNNRPLAGFINFCPSLLSSTGYNEDKLYYTAIHELFHTLGFSNKLFEKFQKCDSRDNCYSRKEPVQLVLGEKRLVTPKVVEVTSKHFECRTHEAVNKFGPMLERRDGDDLVYSHWDSAFMFSSIMTPKLGLPEEIIIDAITLAVFEDTGWYKVNYDEADNFPWGEKGGCDWGRHPACITIDMDEDCFCTKKEQKGCHYLHIGKGVCDTDTFLHGCLVYKTTDKDLCSNPENSPSSTTLSVTGETYKDTSRCFISNLTSSSKILISQMSESNSMSLVGRCYETRCNGTTLEVKIANSPWLVCPNEETITVPGFEGILTCPDTHILCPNKPIKQKPPLSTTTPQASSTQTLSQHLDNTTKAMTVSTTTLYIAEGTLTVVCLDIRFPSLSYDYLVNSNLLTLFKETCLYKVIEVTGVARRRINNISLLKGSVLFRFELLPARYVGDGLPTKVVVQRLRALIEKGNFSISLLPDRSIYVADTLFQMAGGPLVSTDQTPKGVIAGVVVGSVIVAIIIATAVFFVQRYYSLHSETNRTAQSATATRRTSQEPQQYNRSSVGQQDHSNRNSEAPSNSDSVPEAAVSRPSVTPNHHHRTPAPDLVIMRHSPERTSVILGNNVSTGIKNEDNNRTESYMSATGLSGRGRSINSNFDYVPRNSHSLDDRVHRNSHSPNSVIYNPVSGSVSVISSPQEQHNVAVQNTQSIRKPCVLKCKCEWFKNKLKSRSQKTNMKSVRASQPHNNPDNNNTYKLSEIVERNVGQTCYTDSSANGYSSGYYSSPVVPTLSDNEYDYSDFLKNHNYSSYRSNVSHIPRYPPSVVQCLGSPVVPKKDFNSNFYPHYVSLEDIRSSSSVEEFQVQNNLGRSISISSSNHDISSTKQCSVNPAVSGSTDAIHTAFFISDLPEIHNTSADSQYNINRPPRISHRSSCNSFVDSDEHPFYTTSIEIPQIVPKYTELPSLMPSVSCAKNGSSSMINITGSKSSLNTKESESVAASDTDVSFLAKNVELRGNRCSTTSWHSFSSDTSLDSSVLHTMHS